ncbi:MAG: bacterioferritin [Verrucomicrobiia bacterium]
MKGNEKIIRILNELLAEELTAISQYMVHSELCANWGYNKLHTAIEKQAKEEMEHAEWLIQRIIFLEGTPIVQKLNPIRIGKTVVDMISNDTNAEVSAIAAYNDAIMVARELKDNGTAELLTKILKMEEDHLDWEETQKDQIDQMGLQIYLANQI